MVFRTLVKHSATRRIPLIKFRHGAYGTSEVDRSTTHHPQQSSAVAIEDWELPSRYKRLPFTQEEMDYINRGGPA